MSEKGVVGCGQFRSKFVSGSLGLAGILGGTFGLIAAAPAQDLEPRAYANTPVGLNFLLLGYSYMQGGVSTDTAIPLKDAKLQAQNVTYAYARSLDVWGRSGKFDIVLPTAWLSGAAALDGQPVERQTSGFADPKFRFSVNLHGAPSLTLAEFPDWQQDLIVGASVQVSAPGGNYDRTKLVNLGANRWSFKTELALSKRFGPLTLEMMGEGTFFTDNDEFLGSHTRAQNPIYAIQGHVIYSLGWGVWGSLDGVYYAGGSTTVDGIINRDMQENWRIGASLALPVDRYNSLKLYGSSGVSSRTGNNFDLLGVAWQYRFGDGL